MVKKQLVVIHLNKYMYSIFPNTLLIFESHSDRKTIATNSDLLSQKVRYVLSKKVGNLKQNSVSYRIETSWCGTNNRSVSSSIVITHIPIPIPIYQSHLCFSIDLVPEQTCKKQTTRRAKSERSCYSPNRNVTDSSFRSSKCFAIFY